jgi:hypothetical protein
VQLAVEAEGVRQAQGQVLVEQMRGARQGLVVAGTTPLPNGGAVQIAVAALAVLAVCYNQEPTLQVTFSPYVPLLCQPVSAFRRTLAMRRFFERVSEAAMPPPTPR